MKKPRTIRQEAHVSLIRTGAMLRDDMEQMLKPHGLTDPQYNVLRILRGAEPNGLCRNEIRDRMLNRSSDMTRLLDRLEAAGFISRCRETSEDRRQVITRITPKGLATLEGLDDTATCEQERRLKHLEESELETLLGLLRAVQQPV